MQIMRWLVSLALLMSVAPAHGEQLRISTWNLDLRQNSDPAAAERHLNDIGAVLKTLNADVILLQGVRDSTTCERLVELLKPASYRVAVCSEFNNGTAVGAPQVAILSKTPAAAAWTGPWNAEGTVVPPGGYAFAAIPHAGSEIGFFCVQLKNNLTHQDIERDTQFNILKREISAGQLVREADSLERTLNRQPSGIVIGGSLYTDADEPLFVSENTLRILEGGGFKSAFHGLPRERRITSRSDGTLSAVTRDDLFVKSLDLLTPPHLLASGLSRHPPVTCDLTFAAASYSSARSAPGSFWRTWRIPAFVLWMVLVGAFVRSRLATRKRVDALATVSPRARWIRLTTAIAQESDPAIRREIESLRRRAEAAERRARQATDVMRGGMIPHLARLMNHRLFRGVASQRAHLLKTQQAGAEQVAELERRLAKIQASLQDRLGVYERRIRELENEVAAREQARSEPASALHE